MKKIYFILSFLLLSLNVLGTEVGTSCSSDFECESLCCHSDTGTCAPHSPKNNIFCAKESGQTCVANDFCVSYPVVECKIVKSGMKADGTVACTMRCPAVLKSSKCIDYTCVAPATPPVPPFDPNDCSKAEDP